MRSKQSTWGPRREWFWLGVGQESTAVPVATVWDLHHEYLYSLVEECGLYYQGSGEPLKVTHVCMWRLLFLLQLFCFPLVSPLRIVSQRWNYLIKEEKHFKMLKTHCQIAFQKMYCVHRISSMCRHWCLSIEVSTKEAFPTARVLLSFFFWMNPLVLSKSNIDKFFQVGVLWVLSL